MSTFCGGTNTVPAFTTTEMDQIFSNGLLPSAFPAMTDGLAAEDWVSQYIKQLEGQGRIPVPTKAADVASAPNTAPEAVDPLAKYVENENQFQQTIKDEYCFYERRYFAALDSFLQSVANTSLRGQTAEQVQQKLQRSRDLNRKLTLLTQITNGVSKYRYAASTQFQQSINSVNSKLQARQTDLLEQNQILQKETAAAELNKRMMDYTVEKNKANQNLLTMYGVLNLVALGMIFYIART